MTSDKTPASVPTGREMPRDRDLVDMLTRKVVGQTTAMQSIVPYIQMYQAGLNPEGRPVGIFLLLGPTGTGKTRTVEALAEVLHGSEKKVVKIDCGEFQSDHEVAKLIGAPPGYLGHRETQPVLTQEKLSAGALARVPRLDRAVRRDREGGAGALDAAARHPRSRHADARRQHHRQLRAEPHLPRRATSAPAR